MIQYVIISAITIYFAIKVVSSNRLEKVKRAFAGAYDGKDIVISLPKDRNKTIYTEGENKVDLSDYDKFIISGNSLSRVGLPDGAFVYTKPFADNTDIYSLCNRFVIFKYDNQRLSIEHPEIVNLVDGFKARKVVTIFETNFTEDIFADKMGTILASDNDISDKEGCIKSLWKKYKFASEYYKNADNLIVSLTYKKGECKDYSFHSFAFLHGVVRYKSIS